MFKADNLLIKIKVSDNYGNLPLPKYETSGAAGMDLLACIGEDIIIQKGLIFFLLFPYNNKNINNEVYKF